MKEKKSQSSIEFMILLTFLLFVFTLLFAFIYKNMSERIIENNNKKLIEIANVIREEIELAHQSSDGYYRVFEIPPKINSLDYIVNITENNLYIRTENEKYAASFTIKEVKNSNSTNIVNDKNIIENINGDIFINKDG